MDQVRLAAALTILLTGSALGEGEDDLSQLHGALVSAKFSGGCVLMVQMSRFQIPEGHQNARGR